MGSLSCCLRGSEFDDDRWDINEQIRDSNASARLTLLWEVLFRRGGMEPMRLPYQGQSVSQSSLERYSSFGSTVSSDDDGGGGSDLFLARCGKGSSHSRVDPRPVSEHNSQESHPEITDELEKVKHKFNIVSEDDEDVCPICLEEYTIANPRIVTRCSHHYHLSCIYEWNERSESCPVCSQVMMVFEEMA